MVHCQSAIAEFSQFMPFSGYDLQMDRPIFDRQGRYLGSVEFPARLRVHEVGSGYVVGVVADEVGVEHVQLHALHR